MGRAIGCSDRQENHFRMSPPWNEFSPTVAEPQQERRNLVAMLMFDHALVERGQRMIIDLDSWEEGYSDGLLRRPSQCTAGLDRLSYSSGYSQASAFKATSEGPPLRLSTQRAARLRVLRKCSRASFYSRKRTSAG
jgi:hypothetical protein